ncbi:CRISPR-associated protein Cas4 [[Clostridium] colinum]|uniref:CRISPR-associated protein Cas4 n=1 Tax=[Clostridium] colinum TaxID=36835 RepID=UPI002024669B|nr:CRISPR-associated protein Cas4 [[Clostridium] colinum]
MWYFLTFIFLTLTFILLAKSKSIKKTKSKSLAPFGYTLFYTDQNTKTRKSNVIYKKLLFSEKYNIQGKPDFIYKKFKTCYVIELKSGLIKDDPMPHTGDLLQLVTYFLIIEDLYGYKVKKGKLIYKDYCFVVKNTRYLRKYLLSVLSDMRKMLKTGDGEPTCNFAHCRYCMCRQTVCDFYDKL